MAEYLRVNPSFPDSKWNLEVSIDLKHWGITGKYFFLHALFQHD